MKLNFWQIVGILFVVVALIGIAYEKGYFGGDKPIPTTVPSATQPAS